jgi:hypothetical protein
MNLSESGPPLLRRYFEHCNKFTGSWGSAVGIATGYGLDDRGVGVRVPVGSRILLLHVVQTGSGVHLTFYPLRIGGFSPEG